MSNRDSMISCIASLQDQVKVCRGVSSLCPVGKHVNSAKRSGAAGAHELAAVVFFCLRVAVGALLRAHGVGAARMPRIAALE